MDVFKYIAESNPNEAYQICQQHGVYEIQSPEDLPMYLQAIVAEKGEMAFKQVMDLHPDREVILELYQPKTLQEPTPACSCKTGADGSKFSIPAQTNTYILVGALIVSLAIISIKTK